MLTNRVAKAKVLQDMLFHMNALESKVALLNALDRDVTVGDHLDLNDQVTTMTHSLHRLTAAVTGAQKVVGVDAEYAALFGN